MASRQKQAGRGSNPASWGNLEGKRNTAGQIKPGVPLAPGGVRVRMPDEASRGALLHLLADMGGSQADALGVLLSEAVAARQKKSDLT